MLGSYALKHILLFAPVMGAALAFGACTTDDLEAFADGLSMYADELDAQYNAPCPAGLYRQHVSDPYAYSYPTAPWQVDYRLNPLGGGYSYCAAPISPYYNHHGRRHDGDDDYRDGYRDGHRDGERDGDRGGRDRDGRRYD